MISVIHPSYGRPDKSLQVLHYWIDRAKHKNEYTLVLNNDDPEAANYRVPSVLVNVITGDFKSSVEAINYGASKATANIMIVVSDDQYCPNNWDELIFREVIGKRDWVLKTYDGLQKSLITMPIFDRAYFNRFGYVYFPGYDHLFCDTEFSDVAYRLRKVIVRNKIVFPHRQYSIVGTPPDRTAIKNEATYPQGKALYTKRKSFNFGL